MNSYQKLKFKYDELLAVTNNNGFDQCKECCAVFNILELECDEGKHLCADCVEYKNFKLN